MFHGYVRLPEANTFKPSKRLAPMPWMPKYLKEYMRSTKPFISS